MSPCGSTNCSDAAVDGANTQLPRSASSSGSIDETQGGNTDKSLISQTSTLKFDWCGHVPYTQFESQIRDLAHILWPASIVTETEKPFVERIRRRVTEAFGLKEPVSPPQSIRDSKEFVIEHLKGGSYNRVAAITTIEKDKPATQMVFRVPRGDWANPEHDITILQFAKEHVKHIPIPEVFSYDLTSNNPLNSPYVLQKRIPGLDLESKTRSYPDLTHEQKLTFVEEFCQILVDLKSVEHPYAGRIDTRINDKGEKEFTVGPFPYEPESDELIALRAAELQFFKVRKYGEEASSDYPPPDTTNDASDTKSRPKDQTPFHFLMTQFGRFKRQSLMQRPHLISEPYSLESRLVNMAIELNERDYLDSFEDEAHAFCLTHYNLDPCNIMVDIQDDGTLKITGILDWDLAMFAPKWVHCRPPMWIWNWLDGGSEDQSAADDTPPTEEQQELKELWEDLMGSSFIICAYRPEYRMARILFRLALSGLRSPEDYESARLLVDEWEEYCEDQKSEGGDEGEG